MTPDYLIFVFAVVAAVLFVASSFLQVVEFVQCTSTSHNTHEKVAVALPMELDVFINSIIIHTWCKSDRQTRRSYRLQQQMGTTQNAATLSFQLKSRSRNLNLTRLNSTLV